MHIAQAASPGFRHHLSPSELNDEFLEDLALAAGLVDDAVNLFMTKDDAKLIVVRAATWYRRLWASITTGSARELERSCLDLTEAKSLFAAILHTHASTQGRQNALLMATASRLEAATGKAAELIREMAAGGLSRAGDAAEAGDESTWPVERKQLLFKAMVVAAWSNRYIDPHQAGLLRHKLEQLGLEGEARQEAQRFLEAPSDIDAELRQVEELDVRLVFFRHVLGVVYADGMADALERVHLQRISAVLGLPEWETEREVDAFARLHGDVEPSELVTLINQGAVARRETGPLGAWEVPDAADARPMLVEARNQLARFGSRWSQHAAERVAWALVNPVVEEYEAVGRPGPDASFADGVAALSARHLQASLQTALPGALDLLRSYVHALSDEVRLASEATSQAEIVWNQVLGDDAGWEAALLDLHASAMEMLEAMPPGFDTHLSGLGLIDPHKIGQERDAFMKAVVAFPFVTEEERRYLELLAWRWASAVSELLKVTEQWRSRAVRHLRRLFDGLIGELARVLEHVPDTDRVRRAVAPIVAGARR